MEPSALRGGGGAVPVFIPTPVHDANFSAVAEAVGVDITTVPNAGSDGNAFTFSSGRNFAAAQRYGVKTGYAQADFSDAMVIPTPIPVSGSYSVLTAAQLVSVSGNKNIFNQYKSGVIDIIIADNAVRHNGTSTPANGFNLAATSPLNAFVVRLYSYDIITGIMKVYTNEVLTDSGAVPARSGSITGSIVNNSVPPAFQGVEADYMAFKTWSVALTAAQAAAASAAVRAKYGAKYNRFTPPNAQNGYAMWSDSMGQLPDVTHNVPFHLQGLYTPNSFCYMGGVVGNTSAQVKTRFLATSIYRHFTTMFWCGRNNPSDPVAVSADIDAMIALLDDPARYVVISPCLTTSETGPGVGSYDAITALRAYQSARYGSKYIDVQDIVLAHNGDGQHPDDTGAGLIAVRIKAVFDSFGW